MSKSLLKMISGLVPEANESEPVAPVRADLTTHFNPRELSLLCRLFLRIDAPLQVCKSAAGYYIGAVGTPLLIDKYPNHNLLVGEPLSRDSEEYYPTKEAADEALRKGLWTQRNHA